MDFLKLTDTGLKIASRSEIYDQLAIFARSAYGNDITLDEGSSFNSFLQMLADSLSTFNGTVQSFSELFSTKELSGNFLDFVAGRMGIVRKARTNQRVIMTATVDSSVIKPFLASRNTIHVKDNFGRVWSNTTQLMIQEFKFSPDGKFDTEENFQGTCEFGLTPLDGNDTNLLYANNFPAMTEMSAVAPSDPQFIDHFKFINRVNATPAIAETENDAQFRARYDQATYSSAVSTVEGVRSNLLRFANYVRVIENFTGTSTVDAVLNPYGLQPHSIWCIVDGGSKSENSPAVSQDSSDITIAQTILNYKSLGCGVSVSPQVVNGTVVSEGETLKTGNFMCEFPVETITAQIPFTRLVNNTVTFNIVLKISGSTAQDGALRNTVRERVSFALQEYVSSLQAGDIITLSATASAIQTVLSQYEKGRFDLVSSEPKYSIGSGILIYQKAVGGSATVKFSDEV